MSDLVSPGHNRAVIYCAKALLPLVLRQNELKIHVPDQCLEAVHKLDGTPCVIVSPHADRLDPLVAFALAKECNQDFYYLAARELFDGAAGLKGWCLKNCGAYSVVRGHNEDTESKELTTSLIAQGKHKLVMFPEGDVTGRDDSIAPLKEDGLLNILEAQNRILAGGFEQPVFLLPIGIYYSVQAEDTPRLGQCLRRLELALHIHPRSSDLQSRLSHVQEVFVDHLERHYGLGPMMPTLTIQDRLLNIIRQVSISVAQHAGVRLDFVNSESDLLHTVRGRLRNAPVALESCNCYYCDQLLPRTKVRAERCLVDLNRMQQLLILSSTLQERDFSQEHAWRVLDRIEQEILGGSAGKGLRLAELQAAEPISVLDYSAEYSQNRRQAAARLERRIRTALMETFYQLKRKSKITAGTVRI